MSFHFVSLMIPNWCLSHVWEQVHCVARWSRSYKPYPHSMLVESVKLSKNKKIRLLGLKCMEGNEFSLLFTYMWSLNYML